jgi:hypothetical protein
MVVWVRNALAHILRLVSLFKMVIVLEEYSTE